MKTKKTSTVLAIILLLLFIPFFSNAQDKSPSYKEVVSENPDAEADIKVVSDYVNALINNKMIEAGNLLNEKYMGYGPAVNDSLSKQQTITGWVENHKIRTNEKVVFVTQTFSVLQGDLHGHWVSQWGTYHFTQNGKDVKLPYQFTARVSDGKIGTSRIYYDNLAVIETLGYEVTPPKQE